MSIFTYNGSAVVAMVGDNCVALATDRRLGVNQLQTVSTNFPKFMKVTEKTYVGAAGLATDTQNLFRHLRFRKNLQDMKEDHEMSPQMVMNLLASMLYQRRFSPWLTEPIVCGLSPETNKPFIASLDVLGGPVVTEDFLVAGSGMEQLVGTCESLWRPGLKEDELFETISQTLMAALDRDCTAGWGASVVVITPEKTITRDLKTRMD